MKICLACSPGGHLLQIMQLKRIYEKYDHFFLTFRRGMTEDLLKNERVYFIKDPKRNPLELLLNFLQTLTIFLKEKPDVVISTGAGVAVVSCFLAKLFGRKVIFIESFSRVTQPSISGRLVYPVSDLFIIQWKNLLEYYPKAVYGGSIF
ncbi:MAG: PssD/Cps14F family polysaccharide biosynthesis glycosyltransferase [Candidatus Aenigmarchaeota archaeon]|nr:PssD/Cps14F family polysaccharide biosynthesis glycosyltransferase [Candidatus Aenigmarchaeota archaeon]